MKRIIKNSGVTDIRFHDIRHTYAYILIDQGVDIVKISKRLGHTKPRITLEVYAHLRPNSDNETRNLINLNKFEDKEKGLQILIYQRL